MNLKIYTLRASLILTLTVLMTATVWAQAPEKMSYQAVIRNSDGVLVANTQIGMQISILQGSIDGTLIYAEAQWPTTNANGLVSIEIGGGSSFVVVDWANHSYFIKTEIDPTGGVNYSITGTSQLLSVPYALHAKTAGINGNVPGDMLYWNGTEWAIVEAGNEGDILTFMNNKPTWNGEPGVGVVQNPTTGKVWMDRNLGASQVATSSLDVDSYGDLYQWGRAADGHQLRTAGTTNVLSSTDTPNHSNYIINQEAPPYDWRSPQNDNLWQGVNGVNNPCPSGFRIPTSAEFQAEQQSWANQTGNGAFDAPIKLPMAGIRTHFGLYGAGYYGHYWSSTVYEDKAYYLDFEPFFANTHDWARVIGGSVRCIKD